MKTEKDIIKLLKRYVEQTDDNNEIFTEEDIRRIIEYVNLYVEREQVSDSEGIVALVYASLCAGYMYGLSPQSVSMFDKRMN